ncbi:MAG: hypothetical protein R3E66_10110 [bacterium]
MKSFLVFLTFWPAFAWARVPTPHEVVDAALQHAELDSELDPWSARSRLAGLAPQFTVSAGYRRVLNVDDRFREQFGQVDDTFAFKSGQTDTLDGRDSTWSVSIDLKFDLERVVFSRDEFAADETKRRNVQLRGQLSERVLELYFRWLESSRMALSASFDQRLGHVHARDLQEATLDALTGGWFSRTLAEVEP